MTFDQLNRLWLVKCQPTEKLVLLAIAKHADENGKCFPSIPTLAELCGLSERAVYAQVKILKTKKWVTIAAGGGRGHSNTYTLNPELYSGITAKKTLNHVQQTLNHVQRNPERRSPQLYRELPMNGGSPPLRSTLLKAIESTKGQRSTLFMRSAMENSLTGTTWRNPEDHRRWVELGELLKRQTKDLDRAI